jgi:hypothetical protein
MKRFPAPINISLSDGIQLQCAAADDDEEDNEMN